MKNKILWLSILGLALARPPNPIDSTVSNFGEQQKQRSSRSIWPFTSSATTTEAPVNYPPSLPNNNEWFIQGETPLPEGIDLTKYPVWKVHKYNGIDLHPVNLQPENTYPPELQHTVDQGYSSGSSSSSDFSQNIYQNGYQDFGTHSTGYSSSYSSPPATYPAEQENYRTGEFHSSSFPLGSNPLNIQTQQKYEIYAPPEPLRDNRYPAEAAVPALPQIPSASYGAPHTYHAGSVNYQGQNQKGQKQVYGVGGEQSQTSNGGKPDLSFLDDLGGLAPFLPEPTNDNENARQEESEAAEEGFFERLFSRFRGTTDAPAVDEEITETEKPANSGGFLSSVFGIRSSPQVPEIESAPTVSSGNAFSSLFYQSETERPAAKLPTTYYLPKTRGSYVAVKLPTNTVSRFTPSIGPYDDVSNIAFHEVPRVPFTQHEIPKISSPTLDSGYPYSFGDSEIRNSGSAGSATNSNYESSVVHSQVRPPSTKIAPHFTQNYGNYKPSDFAVDNVASNQDDALDVPHAEYMHSANNDQQFSMPSSSSQSSSATRNYPGQQGSQDTRTFAMHQITSTVGIPQSEYELPRTFSNPMTSHNVDEVNQNRNQNLNSQQPQYQSFDTTNSNFQGMSSTQDTFDHKIESLSLDQTVNENEPISAPQISSGFIPSLGYDHPIDAGDQLNSNINNQGNSQQTTTTGEDEEYDHSLDNIDDTFTRNFDGSSVLSRDLVPPKEMDLVESSAPVYQTQISSLQNPSNTPEPNDYTFPPVKQSTNFRDTSSHQDDGNTRFISNLSTLTSYGIPTNSYNSFIAASSNARNIAVPAPMKDEVTDGVNINMNKDVFRSTLPEQLPTKKVDRVVRKVMKRRNFVESNHSRRSASERRAPTEETDTSLITRSEKDLIPEVRDSRQFHGAQVIDGYSKIQHQVVADTNGAVKPVLESVQQ